MGDKTALSRLPPASFDGISFPIERLRVRGGIRDHVHEYLRVPGGQPEKLGRKLYTFSMTALFHDVIARYPDLYPYALDRLVHAFESERTGDLVVPNIGAMRAYCRTWDRELDARLRSGEKVELEFIEDSEAAFLVEELVDARQQSLAEKAATLAAVADDEAVTSSFLDAIRDAANALIAIRDQVDLLGNLVAARVGGLVNACAQADRAALELEDARHARLLDALHEVWASAIDLQQDLLRRRVPIGQYRVPRLMAIGEVSTAIFGDTSHAVELLQLNPIEDPFAVRAGAEIAYYAAA